MTKSKVRARVRRRIQEVEDAEEEGGELNLVPYLDIVINVIMFLLATITVIMPMANINVTSPRYAEPGAAAAEPDEPPDPDDKPPLDLAVTISGTGFIIAGSGGVMYQNNEAGKLPTIPKIPPKPEGEYDYRGLIGLVSKIKTEFPDENRVVLSANTGIPYEIVVRVMDTLREKPGQQCTQECSAADAQGRKLTPQSCLPDDLVYTGACLFPEVLLGTGVE